MTMQQLKQSEREKVCLSESLQSCWDNEVRPGASDMRFCFPPWYKHNVTTGSSHPSPSAKALLPMSLPSALPLRNTATPNPSQSCQGPLSVGSPSVQEHWLGPAYLDSPYSVLVCP
ncbi:unnamed protein product [Pleuronectes platessa]|uniref:Uncharacterized protein n=1 Tax=Pleuronectes platessa TaxID=8262 RepID=A0A9N7YYJ6_PLEPL|nr:unnamed protein product [Pleuronectes platessa]